MKRRARILGSLVLLVTFGPDPVLGIWTTHPNDAPVKFDGWPAPILTAINGARRVYGESSGRIDGSFYFAGNTDDLNTFLSQVAEDRTVVLDIELTAQPGRATLKNLAFPEGIDVDYAWSLTFRPTPELAAPRRDGESEADYERRRRAERAKVPDLTVSVLIHCVGPIDARRLKVPLPFAARVKDPILELVQRHNARRARAERDGTPLETLPPTEGTGRHREPYPLFGPSPSTAPSTTRPATRPART